MRRNSGNYQTLVKVADTLQVSLDDLVERDSADCEPLSYKDNGTQYLGLSEDDHQIDKDDEQHSPAEEKPMEKLSKADIRKKLEMVAQRKPELAEIAHDIAEKVFPQIAYRLDQAYSLRTQDPQSALQYITSAFLTARETDVQYLDSKALDVLLDLCEQLSDRQTLQAISEKYTASSYIQHHSIQALLVALAEKLSFRKDQYFEDELGGLMLLIDRQLNTEE